VDHKAEFEMLTMKTLGVAAYESISWKAPRLLCIAGAFNRYDEHATKQIQRNIELIRYRRYGEDLLLLELLTKSRTEEIEESKPGSVSGKSPKVKSSEKSVSEKLEQAQSTLRDLYGLVYDFQLALGSDVEVKVRQNYIAFSRLKNFSCVEVFPQKNVLHVFLKVDPDSVPLEPGFTRDVRNIGHFGTGDLEITIKNEFEFERAKPLIQLSYENS
jgi:predicted transport protein